MFKHNNLKYKVIAKCRDNLIWDYWKSHSASPNVLIIKEAIDVCLIPFIWQQLACDFKNVNNDSDCYAEEKTYKMGVYCARCLINGQME